MARKVLVLMALLAAASLSDGAAQFELSFTRSTNKVVVTDYYFMLEYSIYRGEEERANLASPTRNFFIKLQMIGEFNQRRWERDREALSGHVGHRMG
jgi:hypothetical protein